MSGGVLTMAKGRGGRPKKEAGEAGTRGVRVYADVAEMLGWILRVDGGTSAGLLDPLIRPQVVSRYAAIEGAVEAIKRAEAQAARVRKGPGAKPG